MASTDYHWTYDARIARDATIVITAVPSARYRLRLKIALALVQLAARIAGYAKVEVRDG